MLLETQTFPNGNQLLKCQVLLVNTRCHSVCFRQPGFWTASRQENSIISLTKFANVCFVTLGWLALVLERLKRCCFSPFRSRCDSSVRTSEPCQKWSQKRKAKTTICRNAENWPLLGGLRSTFRVPRGVIWKKDLRNGLPVKFYVDPCLVDFFWKIILKKSESFWKIVTELEGNPRYWYTFGCMRL